MLLLAPASLLAPAALAAGDAVAAESGDGAAQSSWAAVVVAATSSATNSTPNSGQIRQRGAGWPFFPAVPFERFLTMPFALPLCRTALCEDHWTCWSRTDEIPLRNSRLPDEHVGHALVIVIHTGPHHQGVAVHWPSNNRNRLRRLPPSR